MYKSSRLVVIKCLSKRAEVFTDNFRKYEEDKVSFNAILLNQETIIV